MSQTKSDLLLIKEWRHGDASSYEELTKRYAAKIYSLALRLMKDPEDAEEVLQDVFVTIYRKIESFEGKSSFSSWLYRVTFNAALMKLRKRRTANSISLEDALTQINLSSAQISVNQAEAERAATRGQLAAALEEEVQRLPAEYRMVFVLKDVDGLTSREVSKILDISVPAVKSRLHRARLMMRRRLKNLYQEYFLSRQLLKQQMLKQ